MTDEDRAFWVGFAFALFLTAISAAAYIALRPTPEELRPVATVSQEVHA